MDLGLRGRIAIVTGASGGIGAASAGALAADGASLLLVGRRPAALERTAERASAAGAPRVETTVLDVTHPHAAEAIVKACLDVFGRIDVLVNCAGASALRPYDELTDAEWQAQWDLNVMAPMRLMRVSGPEMARRGWGRIVNVSSSSGKRPSGTNMAYGVTKAAQLSLSRSFAELFASQGVLVNAITPGPIAGDAWLSDGGLADQQARVGGRTRDEIVATVAGRLPLARFGTNEEVAAVIAFLCSERAGNVVGVAWSVDGGAVPGII